MSIKIAVIADDFTGALDSSAPFALAGLTVAAATRPAGLDAALASGSDVVVVNTASRHLSASKAADEVKAVCRALREARPEIVFKKIDSRLKGNVLVETDMVAEAFGYDEIVVAPAIPDQDRHTIDGKVTGRGVTVPLPIGPHVPETAQVIDARTDTTLDELVAGRDWTRTLAVGARGLGLAFAKRFGTPKPTVFEADPGTLFAIGSHDPITTAQIDAIDGRASRHAAPLGAYDGSYAALPALLQSTGAFAGPDSAISRRFARAALDAIKALDPSTLVMSGGDTALAILDELGAGLVFPQGEAAPGLPWFLIGRQNRPSIRCIVKSGGFGDVDTLSRLLA